MFSINSIIFYLGAVFHRDYGLTMKDMFAAIFAILFAAIGTGNSN